MDHYQWTNTEAEWEREKEKVLGSLIGSSQEMLELPAETEVKDGVNTLSAVVLILYMCVRRLCLQIL